MDSDGSRMERTVLKTSTIWIAEGRKIHVFQSVEEVPPVLRRKLEESTSGPSSATILIADRKGREEILNSERMRAVRRNTPSLQVRSQQAEKEPLDLRRAWRQFWAEAALLVSAGAALLRLLWGRF